MSDNFCAQCGATLDPDANYCSRCGALTSSMKRERKQNEAPVVAIVISFLVIALICGSIIVALMFRDHEITITRQYPQTMQEALTPDFTAKPITDPTEEPTPSPTPEPTPTPAAAFAPSPTVVPETDKTYKNSRYGFSFRYPAGKFSGSTVSQNGDGIKLTGENITVTVYGSNNVFHQSLDALYQNAVNTYTNIDYKVKKSNNYVVSGTDGDTMYYVREYVGTESINTLSITYPAYLEKSFDATVTLISNSLKPGNLSEAH